MFLVGWIIKRLNANSHVKFTQFHQLINSLRSLQQYLSLMANRLPIPGWTRFRFVSKVAKLILRRKRPGSEYLSTSHELVFIMGLIRLVMDPAKPRSRPCELKSPPSSHYHKMSRERELKFGVVFRKQFNKKVKDFLAIWVMCTSPHLTSFTSYTNFYGQLPNEAAVSDAENKTQSIKHKSWESETKRRRAFNPSWNQSIILLISRQTDQRGRLSWSNRVKGRHWDQIMRTRTRLVAE